MLINYLPERDGNLVPDWMQIEAMDRDVLKVYQIGLLMAK